MDKHGECVNVSAEGSGADVKKKLVCWWCLEVQQCAGRGRSSSSCLILTQQRHRAASPTQQGYANTTSPERQTPRKNTLLRKKDRLAGRFRIPAAVGGALADGGGCSLSDTGQSAVLKIWRVTKGGRERERERLLLSLIRGGR